MGFTPPCIFFFAIVKRENQDHLCQNLDLLSELESINKKAGYNSINYLYGTLEELYLLCYEFLKMTDYQY